MTREQILTLVKSKSLSNQEDVKVVDYTEEENRRADEAVSLIAKLQEMRKLWSK